MDFLRTLCLFRNWALLCSFCTFSLEHSLNISGLLYPLLVLCWHGHAFCTSFPFCFLFLAFLLHLPCLSTYLQIALAPLGTQACTLDIAKFHHTCPVLPSHKPWLVAQGHPNEFLIDHAHPFGAACASSNAGMIANAVVDIWHA